MTGPVNYARRVDANQGQIVSELRRIGVEVVPLSSVGNGLPDLLCFWRGQSIWIEVKDGSKPPSKRKLTADQVRFHNAAALAGVTIYVATNLAEALAIFGARIAA